MPKHNDKHYSPRYRRGASVENMGARIGLHPERNWKQDIQPTGDLRTRQAGRLIVGTQEVVAELRGLPGVLQLATSDDSLYQPYTRTYQWINGLRSIERAKSLIETIRANNNFADSLELHPTITKAFMKESGKVYGRIAVVTNPVLASEMILVREALGDSNPVRPTQQGIFLGTFESFEAANKASEVVMRCIDVAKLGALESLPLDGMQKQI